MVPGGPAEPAGPPLLVATALTAVLSSAQPSARRTKSVEQTAMLIAVTRPERGDFRPVLVATGSVKPQREVVLSPRVAGRGTTRAEALSFQEVDQAITSIQTFPEDIEDPEVRLENRQLEVVTLGLFRQSRPPGR